MNLQPRGDALTECDREPIHHIAAIQGFGALIAADAAGRIAHASANLGAMLGLEATPAAGTPLATILAPAALETITAALAEPLGPDSCTRRFGLDLAGNGARFDCALHTSCGLQIIELEPHAADAFADHVSLIVPAIARLEQAAGLAELCDSAARLVRQMTGYDRVMIYRFHPDDSGEVIAEERDTALEPYLGLRYPAADIPRQARELFRRNRFRVIADMNAEPVPIIPARGPDDTPLDLSMSMLRAHSKMHLAYMRNMGVGASLAIAIVRHERLWGMIACHHRTPRLPPYSLRTVAEVLSQTFSLMLDRILLAESERLRERARLLNERLLLRLSGGASLADSLPLIAELLGGVIAHDGLSLMAEGRYSASGAAPREGEFAAIAPLLAPALSGAVLATTRLAEQIAEAAAFAERATGALVLPLAHGGREVLVLWRRPLERIVTWAGDPAKAAAPPGEMLQPRASFAAWVETVRGHSAEWSAEECAIAEGLRRTLIEVVLRLNADLAHARARAAAQQDLLIAELNHRVRNILALIRALVAQSEAEALSVPGFAAILGGRIAALAAAHDNITAHNWGPASLTRLITEELAPYTGGDPARFRLTGEDVLVVPAAYTMLALVVHELATNSAKYGALSARAGCVSVSLARTARGDLAIAWRESGGPPVTAPAREGFGSTIITRAIPHELGGTATLNFRLTGLEADFVIPARHLAPRAAEPATPAAPTAAAAPPAAAPAAAPAATLVRPARALVVEDSIIIALDAAESLKRLGVAEVTIAASVAEALAAIAASPPELAIIDFNLGSESAEPIAAALRAGGVRFVLATGYAEDTEDFARLGAAAVLRKPYGLADLARLLPDA
ncbi:HWE histidine kinase domain-containing protein [Erythrobacter cryptus]|uniref:HWE histidine kinase domain-containing protein n=1 Tax=Erythrobacter cryptus TaxID=196588 RepID=UPI0003FE95E9|nr:HWE histidine kinase domain-containing protein [Erythrobacter cryptus]